MKRFRILFLFPVLCLGNNFYLYHPDAGDSVRSVTHSIGSSVDANKLAQIIREMNGFSADRIKKQRSVRIPKNIVTLGCNLYLLRNTIYLKKKLKTLKQRQDFARKNPDCQRVGPTVLSDPYEIQEFLKKIKRETSSMPRTYGSELFKERLNYRKILKKIQ